MRAIVWSAFPEAGLPTSSSMRHSSFNNDRGAGTNAGRGPATIFNASNILSQALRRSSSAAAAREVLIDWLYRERQTCIAAGQGWFLRPSSEGTPDTQTQENCGTREATWVLDDLDIGQEHRQILEEVRSLFGLQTRASAVYHESKQHGLGSTTALSGSQASHPQENLRRKAFEPIETGQNVGHATTLPSQDIRRSSLARLRQAEAAVLDPSVSFESSQEHSRCAPLSAYKLEGAARKAKIFKAQGPILDTTASAMAPDAVTLRSPPAREGLRQSEESTGATDMTSVRATQDSLSNGSHDSVLSTSKSVLRKRTERLAIITKDLANGAEVKHPSLSVDLSRIAPVNTVVMPVSQTYAFPGPHLPHASGVRGYISQLDTQLSRLSGPDVPGNSPGDSQTSSTGHYTASPRSTERHSALQRHPGPSPLSSASYFETHSQRSTPSIQQPRVPASSTSTRSGLSFIVPMFNPDCSLNPSVTAGQMEINLLRMIEAERQKCAMLGIPWEHQQIYALSWVIRNVQSMVSSVCQSNIAIPSDDLNRYKLHDTQLDRVLERVLSSLQDNGPSSVNLRHTPLADISMLNSSHYEPPSTGTSPSWAHAPLPSEISLGSAQS
jgi:hypothetical protein